jgi:DNA-binding MarR family transcriptional regulator
LITIHYWCLWKNNEISHETLYKILICFVRITQKFHEMEKMRIDMGDGDAIYPSEFHVIEAIGSNHAKNVTELSKRLQITKGAVSQVVNKLHEKGFVNKERNKEYGKEIILSLTEKGWLAFQIQDKLHKRMESEFMDHFEGFKPEQIDSFLQILVKVEEFIDTFLREMG